MKKEKAKMRRITKYIAMCLVIISATILSISAHAEGPTLLSLSVEFEEDLNVRVSMDPMNSTVGVGDTVNIDVNVKNAEDLYAFQMKFSYDPGILEEPRILNGSFLQEGFITFTEGQDIEDQGNPGTTRLLGISLLEDVPGKTGEGNLLRISLKAKGIGKTKISIDDALFVDSEQKTLVPTVQGGSVSVGTKIGDTLFSNSTKKSKSRSKKRFFNF